MPNNSQDAPRPLPDRPNLRFLKDQAKDLYRCTVRRWGTAKTVR